MQALCPKCLMYIFWLNTVNNIMRWMLSLLTLYRWANWVSEWLPKATGLAGGTAGTQSTQQMRLKMEKELEVWGVCFMRYTRVSWDLKEDFCPCCSPDGREEKYPFFWAEDTGCTRGISSKGSRSEAPRREGFQVPLGKLAFLSGNYNLSIFGEQGFPQPRNSRCTAGLGKWERAWNNHVQ